MCKHAVTSLIIIICATEDTVSRHRVEQVIDPLRHEMT